MSTSKVVTRADLKAVLDEVLPSVAVDYVVEQGTSGIWTYRKWNSGIAECWGTHIETLSSYYTFTPFYAYYTTVTYPSGLFTAKPMLRYGVAIGSGFSVAAGNMVGSATQTNLYALASTGGDSQSCSFDIHAIGRWK